jgi:hypothetical protein
VSAPIAATPARVVLLGPQRLKKTLADALRESGLSETAPIAIVSAGWQEREPEDAELREHLGGRGHNLDLYARALRVNDADPEFASATRERQRSLWRLQALYRMRLTHAMAACLELLRREEDDAPIREQRREAIDAVRDLDRRHVERMSEIHAEHDACWKPAERAAVAREREAVAGIVRDVSAIAIAGGHVAVLLNRLRLFGIASQLEGKTLAAWSAGAMAVCETVVLFHDDPPHGPGYPEVFERGLALARDLQPFPHARRRLALGDGARVVLSARRFAPAMCVPLDDGERITWNGSGWALADGTRRLAPDGRVATWAAA